MCILGWLPMPKIYFFEFDRNVNRFMEMYLTNHRNTYNFVLTVF